MTAVSFLYADRPQQMPRMHTTKVIVLDDDDSTSDIFLEPGLFGAYDVRRPTR